MIEESKLGSEILAFFTKLGSYIVSIVFGLLGKVGMEIMMNKKYSWIQWTGIVMVSVFCGYSSAVLCEIYEWEKLGKWLPSIATITGQNIAFYFVYNYKNLFDSLINLMVDVLKRKSK